MKQEKVWREFTSLPPDLQQQLIDFIAFLRTRYAQSRKNTKRVPLDREPAIGMWRDREDMQDSTDGEDSCARTNGTGGAAEFVLTDSDVL